MLQRIAVPAASLMLPSTSALIILVIEGIHPVTEPLRHGIMSASLELLNRFVSHMKSKLPSLDLKM